MKIVKNAMSGTLESSDVQVVIEPATDITVEIESSVLNQYGKQIKAVVLETLKNLDVTAAKVIVIDKGALDCTIRARVENAVYRAAEFEGQIPWGGGAKS